MELLSKGLEKKIKKRIRRFEDGIWEYLKLNFQGDHVEKLTDFDAHKRPILLIHGFGGTRRIFYILEKRLAKSGHGVFSIHLGGVFDTFNTHSIDWVAGKVKNKLDRLRNIYGFQELDIIGHSKGGLIGMYLVKALGYEKYVRKIIGLATPHNGTPTALLCLLTPLGLISKSLRQMIPASSFLKKLIDLPYPKKTAFVSIYSKTDWMCPYPSCVLHGPKSASIKNIELKNINHAEFVTKKGVFKLILKELES